MQLTPTAWTRRGVNIRHAPTGVLTCSLHTHTGNVQDGSMSKQQLSPSHLSSHTQLPPSLSWLQGVGSYEHLRRKSSACAHVLAAHSHGKRTLRLLSPVPPRSEGNSLPASRRRRPPAAGLQGCLASSRSRHGRHATRCQSMKSIEN